MSLYSRLDRLAADVEKLNRQVTAVANSPQSQRTSVEGGSIDFNDADGNLMAVVGGQDDGSNTIRHVDGPTPPIPSGLSAHVDGPIVQVSWDGSFEDADTATYDWSHLEVVAVGPNSENLRATINDVTGATANLAATASGEWTVVARSVSRAEKRSLDGDAGTVEVKLVDIDGAIEAVQDSANGKNKVTYSEHAPTESDPGIFDDTWFVGQVGRPNDIVEATNLSLNPSMQTLRYQRGTGNMYASSGSAIIVSPDWADSGPTALKIEPTGSTQATAAFAAEANNTASASDAGKTITVSGNFHLDTPQTGATAANRARRIEIRARVGSTTTSGFALSEEAPNVAGTTRLSVTFTLPPNLHSWFFLLWNGSQYESAYWDSVVINEGATALPYFDGDTESGETDNESHYRWTGTPHASTSEKYLPALSIGDSDTWNVIEQYRHDGTGWVKVELSHHVFSTVDLGKATVGELDGIRIMARTITGDLIAADAFNGRVFTGNTYRTSDGQGQWSDAGWVMSDPDGKLLFNFPTDGSPATIDVDSINIRSASLDELDVGDTSLTAGSTLTLDAGQQAYPRAPEVRADWFPSATFTRPDPGRSYDWTGLAAWGDKWVRTVNVLGSEGDTLDAIVVYDEHGVIEKTIPIDLNPRHGVAVIGDEAFILGPDHVERPGAPKNWFHAFDLNTGNRTKRWEYTRAVQNRYALGTNGDRLLIAAVYNTTLYVHQRDPVTGVQVGADATTTWDLGYTKDLVGVHLDGTTLRIGHQKSVRTYTYSPGSIVRKDPDNKGWTNPNTSAAGFDMTHGWPCVVTESGNLFEGSTFDGDGTTISASVTFRDSAGHETNGSPVASAPIGSRESLAVSIPHRPDLTTRLYYRANNGTWNWADAGEGTKRLWIDFIPGIREANPPSVNTFPDSDPSVVQAAAGPFMIRGDATGYWGPLKMDANGVMSGLIVTGQTVCKVDRAGTPKKFTVQLPAGRFTKPPVVWATNSTTVPQDVAVSVRWEDVRTTSFDLWYWRKDLSANGVIWFAMDSE